MKSEDLKFIQNLMVDSGAFSVWKSGASVNLDEYISFCKKYEEDLQVIVALDVIPGSAEEEEEPTKEAIQKACKEGWENYLKMLSAGLPKSKVVPVFHQFDGWEWLQRYLDFGTPYIGLATRKNSGRITERQWLDQCMRYVCDSEGNPQVKFHGFGITKISFLYRYPWYSCDSTAWIINSRYGCLLVPRKNLDSTWDFSSIHHKILFSTKKGKVAKNKGAHYDYLSPMVRKTLGDFLDSIGFELGKSTYRKEPLTYKYDRTHENVFEKHKDYLVIEDKVVKGVSNDLDSRSAVNKIYFEELQKQLPWPRKFQFFERSIL